MAEPSTDLQRVHDFDARALDFRVVQWPVATPPFEEPELRGLGHRAEYLAMRAGLAVASALPRPLQGALVRSIAGVARRIDRRHTAAARDFVATALPELDATAREAIVVEAWRHLLRVALAAEGVERRVLGRRLSDVYEVHAAPEVVAAIHRPGGLMFVTAHVGYWELATPGVAAAFGRPCYAVGKAPRNDFVAGHVLRMRERQGMRLIPRHGAMQTVPAALREGAVVGLLLDHRPRQKPVYAPYFGRLAACDRSAGVLLRRVAAPIVFYGCYRLPGPDPWRFELRFTKLMPPEALAGLSPEAIAALVNRELEALVLHRPEQHFWLHDRYKGAPQTAPTEG